MPMPTARALAQSPTGADVDEDLRALVALAVHVTEQPGGVTAQEVAVARGAARPPAEYLDAVAVIGGFNFITRMANALGVEPDIAPWVARTAAPRGWVVNLLAAAVHRLVDLRPRRLALRPPGENLPALDRLFGDLGLGPAPDFFGALTDAPHVLETQRELMEALLTGDGPGDRGRLDPETFLTAGLIVLEEVAPRLPELQGQVVSRLEQRWAASPEGILAAARGAGTDLPHPERAIARFARDVTCWPDRITPGRVDELRRCGLGDRDILQLTYAVALWNAFARLGILLAGLPGCAGPAPSPGRGPLPGS
jgi:alkylhydroperoxidase family enzyme